MSEYPKWVVPHDSHVVRRQDGGASCHLFECAVDRATGEAKVLVADESEEMRALDAFVEASSAPEPVAGQDERDVEHSAAARNEYDKLSMRSLVNYQASTDQSIDRMDERDVEHDEGEGI